MRLTPSERGLERRRSEDRARRVHAPSPSAATVSASADVSTPRPLGLAVALLGRRLARLLAGVALASFLVTGAVLPALAQGNPLPGIAGTATAAGGGDKPMLLEADQLIYNDKLNTVTAVGRVQIYYEGASLQARQVTFERETGKVMAEGDVRIVEKNGNVVTADRADVTRDFSTGFASSLQVDTVDRTRFVAEKATREGGNRTVFERGVYTACVKCRETPDKPPTWQIKAAKIVHDQGEKMVYYENARIEFFGAPIMYLPYFSHPDASVRRKTGLLTPSYTFSEKLGFGLSMPYFWAPAEDWDVTFSPAVLTRQGLLADVEVRKAFENGLVSLRGAGIWQLDPKAFRLTSGDRDFRGSVDFSGRFRINERWTLGWNLTLATDRAFGRDYAFAKFADETLSTVFLRGVGARNYFEIAVHHFRVNQDDTPWGWPIYADPRSPYMYRQDKQGFVHPVVDYSYFHPDSVAGGELSAKFNFTSLTRLRGDGGWVDADRDWVLDPGEYSRVYGAAGTYSRFSAEVNWRREMIDSIGQVFTPFASVRGDLFLSRNTDLTFATVGPEPVIGRIMPTVGLEYRYPFVATFGGINHVFEPVVQLVARPDEQQIGRVANEDAQSLVFDDSNLFEADKFSGYDRAEGGVRLNVGFRHTVSFASGGFISALVGRSFHLAGRNSFDVTDRVSTGPTYDTGLQTAASDWVARAYLDTGRGLSIGARARFDDRSFAVNRAEVQATAVAGPLVVSSTYGYLREQPWLGIFRDRQDVNTGVALRLSESWRMFGNVRYDLENSGVVRAAAGIGYDDDSFSASLAYGEANDRGQLRAGRRVPVDRVVYFRFGLRTLGDSETSRDLIE